MKLLIINGQVGFSGKAIEISKMEKSLIALCKKLNQTHTEIKDFEYDMTGIMINYDSKIFNSRYIRSAWSKIKASLN